MFVYAWICVHVYMVWHVYKYMHVYVYMFVYVLGTSLYTSRVYDYSICFHLLAPVVPILA